MPTEAPPPPNRPFQIAVAVALFAIAGGLAWVRYPAAAVDWYLGDLRRDPADPGALEAFRRLGERAVPRLEREIATASPEGRAIAVLALTVVEGAEASRVLAAAARHEDAFTASNAVSGCGLRRDPASLAALEGAAADARWQVRRAARWALVRRSGGLPWWAFGAPAAPAEAPAAAKAPAGG